MIKLIEEAKSKGDSVGGVIECIIKNVPPGLGEPVYDKLEADLAKAILSINACKGFSIGSGFEGTLLYGSEHNDNFSKENNKVITTLIIFRVEFKEVFLMVCLSIFNVLLNLQLLFFNLKKQ